MDFDSEFKVQIRDGFSDRNGIKPINTEIQFEKLDNRTRTALVSLFDRMYFLIIPEIYPSIEKEFWVLILKDVYQKPVSQQEAYDNYFIRNKLLKIVKDTILEDDFDSVLSLIEYVFTLMDIIVKQHYLSVNVIEQLNNILEREYVGYRYVDRYIIPITDQNEIESINEALENSQDKVVNHLTKALKMLSDRDNPDYSNSIKESISAVEAMCSVILKAPDTLGAALKKLEDQGVLIHPALKSAFIQLYGYTSDASGIRHSGQLGGKDATFEEAKYMLVTCTAFINYLKGLIAKVG